MHSRDGKDLPVNEQCHKLLNERSQDGKNHSVDEPVEEQVDRTEHE
jgi:hypothetical protein